MRGMTIIKPGVLSTFQDGGRLQSAHAGMPISGCMDKTSAGIANLLVEKAYDAPVLEMLYGNVVLEVHQQMAIAVTGGELPLTINDHQLPMYTTLMVKPGDVISIGPMTKGRFAYLALSGDVELDESGNSSSTYEFIGIGGYKGRRLKKDDTLHIRPGPLPCSRTYRPSELIDTIRYIPSFEHERFDLSILEQSYYDVSANSSRMGMRLCGEALLTDAYDILSSPVFPGVIQVPGDGQPIILTADAQTTGGYTRLGTVIASDLNLVAQLDKLRFQAVTLDEAISHHQKWLQEMTLSNPRFRIIHQYDISVNHQHHYVFVEEV